MQDVSNKLLLTSWLDDQRGPAKLTARQKELLAQMEAVSLGIGTEASTDNLPGGLTDATSSLVSILRPQWEANEIIKMFHEEKLKIVARGSACSDLMAEVDSVCDKLQSLKDLYQYVSPRTNQLHSECKSLMQERADLKESLDKINANLSKHEELRSIFRRMPDIKNQILSVLNTVFANFQNYSDDSGTALDEFYGRFFIECRRIKELTYQLESCICTSNTDELLLHLEEVYTVYFDIREQLIEPLFSRNIKSIITRCNRNYCDLLRQTSLSAIKILRNEIQLFNQIFSVPPPTNQPGDEPQPLPHHPVKRQALNNFLEVVCKTFYDHLRPVVIHINHIETLAELHKLISDNMINEMPEEAYVNSMRALAQDVQERMVFRTEIFIKESLLEYRPSSGDLAFKEILQIVGNEDFKNFQSLWYPTVQRSVQTLFYLNRVFDAVTFRELAQELSLACLKSLDEAQKLIDERYKDTKMKPNLFKTKHEAILRDQLRIYAMEEILETKEEPSTPGVFGKNLPVLGNFL